MIYVFLSSFRMIISRSIYVAANGIISFLFLWPSTLIFYVIFEFYFNWTDVHIQPVFNRFPCCTIFIKALGKRASSFHFYPLATEVSAILQKKFTMWELQVIWDKMRTTAQETAPQIALRNLYEETGDTGQYMCDFGEGGVLTIKQSSLQKFSASLEELMSAWRD